jgi:hypothetical protein
VTSAAEEVESLTKHRVKINRAPVLTLWASVVAERLGHDRETALTLGKAVAGLNAQSKGRRLGLFDDAKGPSDKKDAKARQPDEQPTVTVLGRSVPTVRTPQGVRAVAKGKPIDPQSVQRYLAQKFGEDLKPAHAAMEALARAFPPKTLAGHAYALYEAFRPSVPEGEKGWGAKGELDLEKVRSLGKSGG